MYGVKMQCSSFILSGHNFAVLEMSWLDPKKEDQTEMLFQRWCFGFVCGGFGFVFFLN